MKNDIKQLNIALKGEHMAILSLDNFIVDESDSNLKEKYERIRDKHQTQAFLIKRRIEEIDGNPIESAGLTGIMADLKYKLSPKKYINGEIIDTIIEGEELGLDSLDDVIKNLTNKENISLIKQIQFENKVIVEELYNLK